MMRQTLITNVIETSLMDHNYKTALENTKLYYENKRLKSELDSYKIALEYFAREGGQPARDVIANMLKEIEVK